MSQYCSKFRVFGVLVFLVLVNIVFFRTAFYQRLDTLWVSVRHDVNSTLLWSDITSQDETTSQGKTTSQGETTSQDGMTSQGKTTSQGETTSRNSVTSRGKTTFVVTTSAKDISTTSASPVQSLVQQTTIQTTKSDKGCHDMPLEAYGKTVQHRADVKPPWKKGDNSSTLCPLVPPKLVGKLATYQQAPNWTELAAIYPELEPGGYYHPPDCKPRHRVAVIVPYRARETHLRVLLHNLHPMLMRQQLDYFILVVELAMPTQFNRAMLLNIGAVEALGMWDAQCFIFHDVDLLPENDRNLYTCPEMPRHMSVAVDKFNYKPIHNRIFGGVSAVSCEHFYKVNGYSNMYFGWGGEDDDLCERLISAGLKISRYSVDIARYRMIKHQQDKKNEPNPQRYKLLNQFKQRMATDGLNSLQYQVQKVEFRPLYTWMLVSVDQDKILNVTKS